MESPGIYVPRGLTAQRDHTGIYTVIMEPILTIQGLHIAMTVQRGELYSKFYVITQGLKVLTSPVFLFVS